MYITLKLEVGIDNEPDLRKFVENASRTYHLIDRKEYDIFTNDVLNDIILDACVQGVALTAEISVSDY